MQKASGRKRSGRRKNRVECFGSKFTDWFFNDEHATMNATSRLILALDGSSATVSAAVLRGEVLLAEVVERADQAHAERILPAIDQALREASVCLEEIEGFAIAVGPGGFTGL